MSQNISIYLKFGIAMFDALFMLIFIIVLNKLNIKLFRNIINFLVLGIITFILYMIQERTSGILHIIFFPVIQQIFLALTIKCLLNLKITKSFLSVYIIAAIDMLLIFFTFFAFSVFNLDANQVINSGEYIFLSNIVIYTIKTILILLIRIHKSRVNMLLNIRSKNIMFMITFILLTVLVIMANVTIIFFYMQNSLDIKILLFLSLIYILYFCFNIILALSFLRIEQKSQELEQQKFYNNTMSTLLSDLRVIKHGYDNTLAVLKGFIEYKEWDRMEEYLDEIILKNSNENLSNTIMLQKIKSAGLAGLIINKFENMKKSGIRAKLTVDEDINEINMKMSDLCESLGILLDNASEAALDSEEKYVKLSVTKNDGIITFTLENSSGNNPDMAKMFEKGWSTKGDGRGLGLWILKNTIRKYKNVLLNTLIDNNRVRQELIIS